MERPKRHGAPAVESPRLSSQSRLRTAPGRGELAPRYAMMREVLLSYLSPMMVDSVLERTLRSLKLSPESMNEMQLAELASDIMVGLRLFVPEERLAQLMLDLAEVLELQ